MRSTMLSHRIEKGCDIRPAAGSCRSLLVRRTPCSRLLLKIKAIVWRRP
jgi:hypothetical protein